MARATRRSTQLSRALSSSFQLPASSFHFCRHTPFSNYRLTGSRSFFLRWLTDGVGVLCACQRIYPPRPTEYQWSHRYVQPVPDGIQSASFYGELISTNTYSCPASFGCQYHNDDDVQDLSVLGNFLENQDLPRWAGLSVDSMTLA